MTTVALPIALAWLLTGLVHRWVHPHSVSRDAPRETGVGPVRLVLKLPGTHAGIAEPLLTCGVTGNATLVSIKLLPGARARVGIEFWGRAAEQSEEFSVGADDAVIRVDCSIPALFPTTSDPYWEGIPPGLAAARRNRYLIAVDGRVRLTGAIDYRQPPHPNLYIGVNPLGGSVVSSRFTGSVLSIVQH